MKKIIIKSLFYRPYLIALLLFLTVLIFKAPRFNTPYYWDSISLAAASHQIYSNNMIPAVTGRLDKGHPLLFHTALALSWKIAGTKLWVSHLMIMIFSFIGIYFTYMAGLRLRNSSAGWMAALFLFFSPVYYTMSGRLELSVPLTAMIAMAIFFYISKKPFLYALSASCLVLTKEPGVLLVLSVILYWLILKKYKKEKNSWATPAAMLMPLFVFILWLLYHKHISGWTAIAHSGYHYDPGIIMTNMYHRMNFLFSKEYRFILTGLMISYVFSKKFNLERGNYVILYICSTLAVRLLFYNYYFFYIFILIYIFFLFKIAAEKKVFFLFNIFIFMILLAFSAYREVLERYLLPAYPLYYLMAAYCFSGIMKDRYRLSVLLSTLYIFILLNNANNSKAKAGLNMQSPPGLYSGKGYLSMIEDDMAGCRYLSRNYHGASVVAGWPQIQELRYSYLGYVDRAFEKVTYVKKAANDYDIVFYSSASPDNKEVRNIVTAPGMELIKKFNRAEIYKRTY